MPKQKKKGGGTQSTLHSFLSMPKQKKKSGGAQATLTSFFRPVSANADTKTVTARNDDDKERRPQKKSRNENDKKVQIKRKSILDESDTSISETEGAVTQTRPFKKLTLDNCISSDDENYGDNTMKMPSCLSSDDENYEGNLTMKMPSHDDVDVDSALDSNDNNFNLQGSSFLYTELCKLVEYYLSDSNLRKDDFYRGKIQSGKDGWFSMDYIMSAPKVKSLNVDVSEVVKAVASSKFVETRRAFKNSGTETETKFVIRRKKNKALPAKQQHNSRHGGGGGGGGTYRRRGRYNSDYGFEGGGFGGYSSYDCDRLLECGVKPWDDGADNVLGALHDF